MGKRSESILVLQSTLSLKPIFINLSRASLLTELEKGIFLKEIMSIYLLN